MSPNATRAKRFRSSSAKTLWTRQIRSYNFYVNRPVGAVMGVGEFEERVVGEIEKLWKMHSSETVFESHDEYLHFPQGRSKATFIRFSNLRELHPPIPLEKLRRPSDFLGFPGMANT